MTEPVHHVLGIADLGEERARRILDGARAFYELNRRDVKKAPTLRGKTVINLFFEASTRTRTSFELAGKRLSADVVNISASTSSATKGESLKDTITTLGAMKPDVVVVRHPSSGAAHYVSQKVNAAIVNAGDGTHEHPTQALLDAYTILQHKQKLAGLRVAICGDIAHSRVARSNALLLRMLGADVRLAGLETMMPAEAASLGGRCFTSLDEAIDGVDVVMMLRIQTERLGGVYFSSLREYSKVFGLNMRRLERAAPGALVMHPGPMNRGVEIDEEVAESRASVVLDQVEAGVAVRMAVLYLCAHGEAPPTDDQERGVAKPSATHAR